jgi:hypothetical protein
MGNIVFVNRIALAEWASNVAVGSAFRVIVAGNTDGCATAISASLGWRTCFN